MKSWNRKLRMGIVGGGQGAFIGAVHRMAAALDQQVELVAGCFSRDPQNTRVTGKALYLDPRRCYGTYAQMAASERVLPAAERMDFVVIVTPNSSHCDIARTFLEAGFHVVCDKPLTYDLPQARTLATLVQRTGLVFGLTHNYTGYPMVRHARHLFRTGQMGAVRKAIIEYLQDFLMFPHEKHGHKQAAWRVDPAQEGAAGALGDVGSHCINLLEYVSGDPIVALCADKSTFLPDRTLNEDANILLRFRGGGKGVMVLSQVATGEENALRLRLYASEGALQWEQEDPNHLRFYQYGKPRQILTRAHAEYLSPAAAQATRIPTGHPEGFIEAFANIYCGFIEAVRRHADGSPMNPDEYDFPTVADGLRGMMFIAKAVESADSGAKWVSLDSD